jgi:flagellar basal-body rod modification protein FlgD
MTVITDALTAINNSTAAAQAERAKANAGNTTMGQDDFLQLMMMQMKNQDPMNPMDSSQFLAQQAQFTQISELQKLNKSNTSTNQFMQASNLLGKQVSLTDPNNTDTKSNTITGVVTESRINSTGASIVVNSKEYPVSSVTKISNATSTTTN